MLLLLMQYCDRRPSQNDLVKFTFVDFCWIVDVVAL